MVISVGTFSVAYGLSMPEDALLAVFSVDSEIYFIPSYGADCLEAVESVWDGIA